MRNDPRFKGFCNDVTGLLSVDSSQFHFALSEGCHSGKVLWASLSENAPARLKLAEALERCAVEIRNGETSGTLEPK